MKYSYYPGCTLKTKAQHLDKTAREAAKALGIDLAEIGEWQCCGAVYPQVSDEIASRLSAVRALMSARDKGATLVTMCSACHHVLKRTNEDLKADENFAFKANTYLKPEIPYRGEAKVIHFLELLRDEYGFDEIRKRVVRPLTGKKIGAYYGCLLLRPGKQMNFDNPENPTIMEDFIRCLGATPVVYAMRNECCGGYIALEDEKQAAKSASAVVASAKDKGAEMLITACPLCMYNLKENAREKLPVKYFTELLSEALGLGEENV